MEATKLLEKVTVLRTRRHERDLGLSVKRNFLRVSY